VTWCINAGCLTSWMKESWSGREEKIKVFGEIDVKVGREDVAFEVSSEFRMKLYVSCIERRRRRKGLLL
jgi:hypothetical protein